MVAVSRRDAEFDNVGVRMSLILGRLDETPPRRTDDKFS